MKYFIYFIIALVMVANFSCNREMTSFTGIKLNTEINDILCSYMDKYPQFNTFLLMHYIPQLDQINGCDYCLDGYLFGPLYEGIFKKEESPIFCITIANKRIFVMSGIESLINTSESPNAIFLKNVIPRGTDSLVFATDWIMKDGGELYIHRAIYFSKHKGYLYINNRPDTIFAPRLKETIEFKNIK